MLESLSGLGKAERQSVLSSVALSLLPSPTPEPQYQIDDEVRHRVLAESREHLSLAPDDDTPDARSQVVDFLGNQISESVLRGVDFNRIKSRLGDKGNLLPSEYEIKITPEFRGFMDMFRLDEAEVTEAVSHPDEIQHFFYDDIAQNSSIGASLCAKSFGGGQDRYTLIVGLERVGQTMIPNFAWRVFLSEVDIRSARSPLEVVKAFADRYGLRFKIGDLPPAKFYENQVIAPKPGTRISRSNPLVNLVRRVEFAKAHVECGLIHRSPLGPIFIRFSMTINLDRYSSDLEKHGIKIVSSEEMNLKKSLSQLQIGKL